MMKEVLRTPSCRSTGRSPAAAENVRPRAYAPYSKFLVGSALRTQSGETFVAVNMENASYGLSLCAEAAVLARCVAESGGLRIAALAVVGGASSPGPGPQLPTVPCGRCRQLLHEAAHQSRADIRVLCAHAGTALVAVTTASQLLPFGFGPEHLHKP